MLQTLNLGKVSTAKLVCDLVLWSEQLLKERYTLAKRKRMQIFDPDPNIRNIFNEASEHLTDQGCFLFKEMVTKLGNRKPFLSVVGDCAGFKGVFSERTKNQSEKSRIFQTTVQNCSCVWKQHNSSGPCHHILFLRSHLKLPLFDKLLFGELFYREIILRNLENVNQKDSYEHNSESDDSNSESEDERRSQL